MAHIQLIGVAEGKSPDGRIWKFPCAFPIIISSLLQTGHSFEIVDTHLHKKTGEELLEFLKGCNAKIYGISAFSHNYYLVKEICKQIKEKHPDSIIIVGGILSGNYDVLMKHARVDIVATAAEGEKVLPEILDAIDAHSPLQDVHGIVFRDKTSGEIIKTPQRRPMSNSDFKKMPMPAYTYFDRELRELSANLKSLQDVPVKGFPLITMRGCPFSCTFCGHLYGKRFLKKDWNAFFDELEFLMEEYGMEGFYSLDTNMFFNERQVDEYCRIYRERKHTFKMIIELRPTFGNYRMFRKLREHGVRVVLFGIESGSQRILDNMKKKFNLHKMKSIFRAAVDAGLMIHGNFLFGTPGEDRDSIRETRTFMLWMERLIHRQKRELEKAGGISTSGYGWTVLIPSPTSELYDIAMKQGLIKDEEEYLVSLSGEKIYRLVKGSHFKIALGHVGGNVNMSRFPSKRALMAYVKYSHSIVRLHTLLLDKRKVISNSWGICRHVFLAALNYGKYAAYALYGSISKKNNPRAFSAPVSDATVREGTGERGEHQEDHNSGNGDGIKTGTSLHMREGHFEDVQGG